MKRVLVTGGAGFIGSQLCERLLEWENEIRCVTSSSFEDCPTVSKQPSTM